MRKIWNSRGIRGAFGRYGKPSGVEAPRDSVFRLGIQVPVISKFFVRRSISAREKAIQKMHDSLRAWVVSETSKIENVIKDAKKTNSYDLVTRALALPDKLEEAACARPGIKVADEVEIPREKKRVEKTEPINIECIRAIARGVFGKDEVTGMVRGKGASQRFKRDDLNVYLDKCIEGKGSVKIPGSVVDALTGGAKKSDVEINVGD